MSYNLNKTNNMTDMNSYIAMVMLLTDTTLNISNENKNKKSRVYIKKPIYKNYYHQKFQYGKRTFDSHHYQRKY